MKKNVSRRDFLRYAAAGAAAGVAAGIMPRILSGADDGAARPNIVYIMSDDHAAHAISAYGSRINKTPNIDRLAKEGMKLENCFCTNSLCGPSRAVMLTGKYTHKNGFYDNNSRFDGTQPTVAKMLQAAGYQTAVVGKWHLVSDPTGFDYWKILPGQGAYHNPPMIEMGKKVACPGYVTDIITDTCMDWLKRRDKNRPFFLVYHHKAPHRNWQPDEKHAKMYENEDIPLPETFWDDYAGRSEAAADAEMRMSHLSKADLKAPIPEGLDKKEETKWRYQRYIKDYLRCIASIDDNMGRFLKFLDDEKLADNTIVIYTSDQGFYLGDHNWFDKRFMYDPSLRMPFLVRYPGHIKPGAVRDDLCVNIDFAPTFLDYAGQPADKEMDGVSMRPVLEGRTPRDWRTSMYYHYYEYPAVHAVKRHFGVRSKRYKLIHYYYDIDAWELFDLEKDPWELKSVYGDPAYAKVQADMLAELTKLQTQYGDSLEKAMEQVKKRPQRGRAAPGKPVVGVQLLLTCDGAQADLAADASGAKRAMTCHGTTVVDAEGAPKGKARKFNGTSDWLELAQAARPNPDHTPLAVGAWINPSKADGMILGHGGASCGYALHLVGGKAAFSVRVEDVLTTAQAPEKLPAGWRHVTGSLDADGTLRVCVDGKQVAAAKAAGLLTYNPADGLAVGADRGSSILDKGEDCYGGLIGQIKVSYGPAAAKDVLSDARH